MKSLSLPVKLLSLLFRLRKIRIFIESLKSGSSWLSMSLSVSLFSLLSLSKLFALSVSLSKSFSLSNEEFKSVLTIASGSIFIVTDGAMSA